jgi:glycosyltransferase involved in cell wall biosynthesis
MPLKRLCIVAPGHWSHVMGGAQYQTLLLVQALAATGRFEVSYIAKFAKPDFRAGDHRLVKIDNNWNRTRSHALDGLQVLRALREVRPDVIYHRGSTAYSGVAAYYARRAGIRSVWHIASTVDVEPFQPSWSRDLPLRYLDRKVFEYCLRHPGSVIAQTRDQARSLRENFGREADVVIYNFHPLPERPSVKVEPAEVLWVGNLKPLKQPEHFIRAAAELRDRTNARFIMVGAMQGSGRWQRRILSAIRDVPNLTYRGGLPQEEVNRLLDGAAILVNTSIYEGFSNTFVQAWMRRVPVVSLNVNPDDLLSDGSLGAVSGDPRRLAADILRLLTDVPLRESIGERAYRHALDNHSLNNIQRLVSVLDQ